MTSQFSRIASLTLLLFVGGCASLTPLLSPPTPVPSSQVFATPQAIPTAPAPPVTAQPLLLRVWLPPRFDPNADTPSAALLKTRLEAFEAEHAGVKLDIRIKAETDILRMLSLTNTAAPAAMPDLIALSYWNMQKAALTGLLRPLDGLTDLLQDPDWYAFARELGHLKNVEYGIPFAGDVLLLVHRPDLFDSPPASWSDVFVSVTPLAFPASDARAAFPLTLYLSSGLPLADEQGALTLDEETLVRVFALYRQGIGQGMFPLFNRDHSTDKQSLEFYRSGHASGAVVWISSDLPSPSGEYLPLLGLENGHYTIGDGWLWALAGTDIEHQALAVELASYLVESGFMSEWTRAAGFLPLRPQALDGWTADLRTPLHEALQSAHPLPPEEAALAAGPLLQQALRRLFNGELPEVVARSVIEELK